MYVCIVYMYAVPYPNPTLPYPTLPSLRWSVAVLSAAITNSFCTYASLLYAEPICAINTFITRLIHTYSTELSSYTNQAYSYTKGMQHRIVFFIHTYRYYPCKQHTQQSTEISLFQEDESYIHVECTYINSTYIHTYIQFLTLGAPSQRTTSAFHPCSSLAISFL